MLIVGESMILNEDAYLEHHGILGQRWGVRRFQNADGSYKPAGKIRYSQASREASGSGHIKEQHRSNVQAINDMNISQKKKKIRCWLRKISLTRKLFKTKMLLTN